MRSIWLAAAAAVFLAQAAQAAGLVMLVPPVVANAGVRDLAAAYTKETGIAVTIKGTAMDAILKEAQSGTPAADVVALPTAFMDQVEHDKGIVPGSRKSIGRMEIALAVKAGAPKPDISTPEKALAVLKGAQGVVYSDPKGGTMMGQVIGGIMIQSDFQGIHSVIPARGNGVGGLAAGQGDMALQLEDEIEGVAGVSDVGPLPPVFGAHIDSDVAISARSADPKAAAALIAYLLRPASDTVWKSKHMARR